MKEQACAKGSELHRAAIACGMDIEDAFDDVISSIAIAFKAVPPPNVDEVGSSQVKWWSIFLTTYSSKCVKRWIWRLGKSKDYEAIEKLWLTSFEPLWIAGCNFAKQSYLHWLGKALNKVVARYSDKNRGWADEYLLRLNEAIPEIIAGFKEAHRETISLTVEELKEYDRASFLGKLKRWMSSR